jgi:hypothetical protein
VIETRDRKLAPAISAAHDGAMKNQTSDADAFFAALALYDRPESELHTKPLDADVDVDGFVEAAFGNVTLPPA